MALAAEGHDVEIIDDGTIMVDATVAQHDDRPWEVLEGTLPDADVVIIQRPSHPAVEALVRYFVKHGIKVVVDIDDRFDSVPVNNMAWEYYRQDPRALQILRQTLANATAVTVSTPDLQELHNGILIENCIPNWYLDIPDDHDDIVGWAGSLSVHKDDLTVVGSGIGLALRDAEWEFRVVGVAEGVKGELGLPYTPAETGWLAINQYPYAVAKLGIGIAPILDNRFNRAKSWLKALEYGALGVPFIASDMPEYRRLGIGMLAANPRQWKGMLTALMKDPAMREDMRLAGRACARKWTFEGNTHRWGDVWLKP
jgi:glycosyltransferase involved in cell wall biosynthesis